MMQYPHTETDSTHIINTRTCTSECVSSPAPSLHFCARPSSPPSQEYDGYHGAGAAYDVVSALLIDRVDTNDFRFQVAWREWRV